MYASTKEQSPHLVANIWIIMKTAFIVVACAIPPCLNQAKNMIQALAGPVFLTPLVKLLVPVWMIHWAWFEQRFTARPVRLTWGMCLTMALPT